MDTRLLPGIFRAGSLGELRKAIEANIVQLGFRYFLFCGRFSAVPGDFEINFDNCPEPWRAYYRRHYVGGDNGSFSFRFGETREVAPALWRELAKRAPDLFAEARKFGLATGSTHPVHGPDQQWSTLSFIKDRDGVDIEMEVEAKLADCQLIATYVHDAAVRLAEPAPVETAGSRRRAGRRALNERERQVLALAAAGMTSARIADTLAISRRTVAFHLASARGKLGASNSRHAIGKALSLGLIDMRVGPRSHSAEGNGV